MLHPPSQALRLPITVGHSPTTQHRNPPDTHRNSIQTTMSVPDSPAFSYADAASGVVASAVNDAYEDALDDVHTRFILNLPPEELATADRIFFQLEQAWWFYDDFICDNSEHPLPRFKNVRSFAIKMFEFSPILQPMTKQFDAMWGEFSAYKRQISTYGTILMNESCTKVLLCQVWKGETWTFPAGKVNQNEHGKDAAARETYEETGFDPNCNFGVTKQMQAQAQVTGQALSWQPLQSENGLVYMDGGKRRTCYVCKGVPENFEFAPVARKEVSQCEWHELDSIPKKSFAVLPFIKQLRRWIRQDSQRSKTPNKKKKKGGKNNNDNSTPGRERSESAKKTGTPGRKRTGSAKKPRSRTNSRGKVREGDDIAETGLAGVGDESGWTEEDMFKVNEKILGRKVDYDGNPHVFAEEGFAGKDPHAFKVVGGSFMNSGVSKLAPAPDQSKLQPLFRKEPGTADGGDDFADNDGLQPFFSEGITPWGELVADAVAEEAEAAAGKRTSSRKGSKKRGKKTADESVPEAGINSGLALLNMLQQGGSSAPQQQQQQQQQQQEQQQQQDETAKTKSVMATGDDLDLAFMTDKEITARSQQEKKQSELHTISKASSKKKQERKSPRSKKSEKNAAYIRDWVKKLPESPSTELFGDFRFDVDKIMNAMNVEA